MNELVKSAVLASETDKSPPSGQHEVSNSSRPNDKGRSFRAGVKGLLLAVCGVKRRVAAESGLLLTFDDGPHPDVTPAVLDLLAEHNARAVFFVVGNRIPRAPHLLQRILAEGHLIGNHTFYHPLDHIPAFAEYRQDVNECQDVLKTMTGRVPRLFRPPLGSITAASLLAPRLAGLRTILWSLDVDDWTLRRESDAVSAGQRLADSARAGDIVLLHDDNPSVIPLLATALRRLRAAGLALDSAIRQVAVDE